MRESATAVADRRLVNTIRTAVLHRLGSDARRDGLKATDQRELLRSWVEDELAVESRRRMTDGEPQLDRFTEVAVLRAVENTVWGLGRLQQLLDLHDVEDIHIVGADRPMLRMADGSLRRAAEPIADSDDDLIQQLQFIAAHHGASERAFSPAQPCLNLQLPDGSRLAAMRDVVPHPVVTIRRHRLLDVGLSDMVRLGTLTEHAARFLAALVGARCSLLVTGAPACGKTTLVRALAKEIPAGERIATLETEYELALHRLPGASPLLVALETRPGSTEIDAATGQRAGEITLSELLHQTLRMSVTRVIVGEVRGAEALPMLEAMNAGMPGSMCTLHAGSAADAIERLVTAALKAAGQGWSDTFVTRLAAQGIDYVVHMRHTAHPGSEGRRRFVAEIAEVTDVNENGKVAMNRIFAEDPESGDPRAAFRMAPQIRWPFHEAGIDIGFLTGEHRGTSPVHARRTPWN
ncbi:CpaF family protein [Pseudonocardia sp. KRD-184]|uniref:CpaF family protein n=1 Tax=Pseudonocardia oceani TaxID=2792013 RepID=UPI001C49D3B9|nr:CpaF/VirB11 family protein [Pseudonocardia oceani]MBW0088755.1 CpaF family protein [Pseudonocardia oceani]MBW0094655.1 CpaF family protein [Pseudonocardia oceani]